MDAPIELQFQLSQKEFVRAVRRSTLRHPFTWGVGALSVLAAGFVVLSSASARSCSGLTFSIMLSGGAALYFLFLILIAPGRTYDRVDRNTRDALLCYTFTTTGIALNGPTSQHRWDWLHFGWFTDEKDALLIYPKSDGTFILLPKRAFASPESLNSLRQLLSTKLKAW